MEDKRNQAVGYINEVFQYFYKLNAPPQLIDYYTQIILNASGDNLSTVVHQVREHIQALGLQLVQKYSISPTSTPTPTPTPTPSSIPPSSPMPPSIPSSSSPSPFSSPSSAPSPISPVPNIPNPPANFSTSPIKTMSLDLDPLSPSSSLDPTSVREYVDLLYTKYTGKVGDPASTQFLLRSIMDKSFTLTQAEFHVRYSKEGKAYVQKSAKIQEEQDRNAKMQEYVKELFRVYLPARQPTSEEINSFVSKLKDGSATFQEVEDDVKMLALVSVKPPSNIPKH